jgi:hypothetical protein
MGKSLNDLLFCWFFWREKLLVGKFRPIFHLKSRHFQDKRLKKTENSKNASTK